MLAQQNIGVVGMGVMGQNIALNIESRGYKVSVFNRTKEITEEFVNQNLSKNIVPFYSIRDFIFSIEKPRRILFMIKSGISVDKLISSLIPYLDKGDILLDAGNSFYKDTIRRYNDLLKREIYFIGVGISGGAYGALHGPALMPGGHKDIYDKEIKPIFEKISACFNGEYCVNYMGSDGAGHYVKMIHNGIEYGDMQLIAESYMLLKFILNINNGQLSEIFDLWNNGELNSYLIEITACIFSKLEIDGSYLIDSILDEATHKGTGQWTSQDALDLGEPLSIITESVFARYLSSIKNHRILASKILSGPIVKPFYGDSNKFIEKIRRALYLGKIISYAQGFSQLKSASEYNKWYFDFVKIAKVFRAGCIIRAQFLQNIIHIYTNNLFCNNLLLSPYFKEIADNYQQDLRDVVSYAVQHGIAVPAFSAAITYYDGYRSAFLPANLIQAQRDYFGSHGYKRIDRDGIYYTNWG